MKKHADEKQDKQPTYQNGGTSYNEDNQNKVWRGLKQDPRSGKFIVYITESAERLFDDIDSAIDYMVSASSISNITKTAGAPEYSGQERGQDNIEGVKEITKKYKLVLDKATGKWKVKESTRTDLLESDEKSAADAYRNIEEEKFKAEPIKPVEQYLEENKEENKEKTKEKQEEVQPIEDKESSVEVDYGPVATCSHCGCAIYPYSVSDEAFDRQQLADAYCPACGYGLGEAKPNEQSVDNLIKGY